MAVIKLNGAAAVSPSALKVEIFDVGSAETRSASGQRVVDRVAVKRRLTLRWAMLSAEQAQALMAFLYIATDGKKFQATYPDPALGERTGWFGCETRSAGVMRMVGGAAVWTDVEMQWAEV